TCHRHFVPKTVSPERVVSIRGFFTRRRISRFSAKVELSLLCSILELGPDRRIIFRLVRFVARPLEWREDGAAPYTLEVRLAITRAGHFANFVFGETCLPVVRLVRCSRLTLGGRIGNRLSGAT